MYLWMVNPLCTLICLDDVIKWKHFPRYWPFVRGIHQFPVNYPHKGQWRGALMFSLICARINGWVNNREAGDLRCHCAHYDVTVMPVKHVMMVESFQHYWSLMQRGIGQIDSWLWGSAMHGKILALSFIRYLSLAYNFTWQVVNVHKLVQTDHKETIKAPHCRLCGRGIHWSSVDSHHKGPVIQKAFPCQNIIMCVSHRALWEASW